MLTRNNKNVEIINPFTELINWIEVEELELEAISEAIISFTNLLTIKDNLNIRLINITNDISTIVFNRFSFKFLFRFKNRQEIKLDLEEEKVKLTNEIQSLEEVIKYSAKSLYGYIENLKRTKLNEYFNDIRVCSIIHRKNTIMVNIFLKIANNFI